MFLNSNEFKCVRNFKYQAIALFDIEDKDILEGDVFKVNELKNNNYELVNLRNNKSIEVSEVELNKYTHRVFLIQNFELKKTILKKVLFFKKEVDEEYSCPIDLSGLGEQLVKSIYQKMLIPLIKIREYDKLKIYKYRFEIEQLSYYINKCKISGDFSDLKDYIESISLFS